MPGDETKGDGGDPRIDDDQGEESLPGVPTPEEWQATKAALRAANREAASRRKEIERLEAKIDEMTASQQTLQEQVTRAEGVLKERDRRAAVETAALARGFHPQGAKDVFAFLELDDVVAKGDDGGTGLDADALSTVLDAAAQARPYLLDAGTPAPQTNVADGGESEPGAVSVSEEDIAAQFGL